MIYIKLYKTEIKKGPKIKAKQNEKRQEQEERMKKYWANRKKIRNMKPSNDIEVAPGWPYLNNKK